MALLGPGSAMSNHLALCASAASTAAATTDFKALVCVFLYGGSDSFNMQVPSSAGAYASFAAARPALRVAREDLLLNDSALGFHPSLSRTHELFKQGNLAVVSNVGNLIRPTSRTDFLAENDAIPTGLFAHDTQQEQWQKGHSSSPASLVGTGWGGRIADQTSPAIASSIAPNISIAGSNFWTQGGLNKSMSIHPRDGLVRLNHLDGQLRANNAARESTLEAIFSASGNHPMKDALIERYRSAKQASRVVTAALADAPVLTTPFDSSNRLASQLNMVARLIGARSELNIPQQVFFVGLGGWDTHSSQAVLLPQLLGALDNALGSFYSMLEELGVEDSVTTFTASDFGRSLTINGDGTDHGWGGNYMVLGGAVNGGQLYGRQPDYSLGGPDDAGEDGRIIPSTSINQYGAVLARWLGVDNVGLTSVFPDLENFGGNWDQALDFI